MLRLGINIDHVATLRNARGGHHPDPVRAARMVEEAGGQGITVHLREDRRHIRDADVIAIDHLIKSGSIAVPMNLEMAATPEMQEIALKIQPHAVCIVPEKREEITTEGGLDVAGQQAMLQDFIQPLLAAGIRVSLFIDADERQIKAAETVHAPVIELHTGAYAHADQPDHISAEIKKISDAALFAYELGIECHAGHGLTYQNVSPIAAIPQIIELNIGHFLMGEALYHGFVPSIRKMRTLMDQARMP